MLFLIFVIVSFPSTNITSPVRPVYKYYDHVQKDLDLIAPYFGRDGTWVDLTDDNEKEYEDVFMVKQENEKEDEDVSTVKQEDEEQESFLDWASGAFPKKEKHEDYS